MSELAEYERRIAYALERIGRGVETLSAARAALPAATAAPALIAMPEPELQPEPQPEPPRALIAEIAALTAEPEPEPAIDPGPSEEVLALQAALAAERVANEQLTERVRAIREKQETTLTALERRLVQATKVLEAVQAEANRLKRANAELIDINRALVDAAGTLAPHLVNLSMQAELEAMRAARAWEASELSDIIAGLAPIVAAHARGAANGPGNGQANGQANGGAEHG